MALLVEELFSRGLVLGAKPATAVTDDDGAAAAARILAEYRSGPLSAALPIGSTPTGSYQAGGRWYPVTLS